MKKTPEILRPVGGVYRVPLRRVFNKDRVEGDATWDQVYGNQRCVKCHKHLQEGQAYTIVTQWKGSTGTVPVQKGQHVECEK